MLPVCSVVKSFMNLAQLLAQHLSVPDRVLYSQFVDGAWRDFSALDVAQLAARWQQAFRREGLQAGERVAICLRNSVNWVAVDMAALGLGLVVVPLYVDDNPENIAWCLRDSGARLAGAGKCPSARSVTGCHASIRNPSISPALPRIVCLQDGSGTTVLADWLPPVAATAFRGAAELDPDTLATIVYTSGTTGRPKGVMLSHRNILSQRGGIAAKWSACIGATC